MAAFNSNGAAANSNDEAAMSGREKGKCHPAINSISLLNRMKNILLFPSFSLFVCLLLCLFISFGSLLPSPAFLRVPGKYHVHMCLLYAVRNSPALRTVFVVVVLASFYPCRDLQTLPHFIASHFILFVRDFVTHNSRWIRCHRGVCICNSHSTL